MFKSIVTAASIVMLANSSFAEDVSTAPECEANPASTVTQITTVKVNGMVCDFCARAVIKVFTKNDRVDAVDVDLDAGAIIFETHGCEELDEETIRQMVHYSGYDFVSIERSLAAPNNVSKPS